MWDCRASAGFAMQDGRYFHRMSQAEIISFMILTLLNLNFTVAFFYRFKLQKEGMRHYFDSSFNPYFNRILFPKRSMNLRTKQEDRMILNSKYSLCINCILTLIFH